METIKQQISKLIEKSENILVATPENISGDTLGSALSIKNALKKLGKNAQIFAPEEIPPKFEFLPNLNSLSYEILQEKEFILSINNRDDHIKNLYYEKTENLLRIYLGTKEKIEDKDLKISHAHPFDLIFAINVPSLNRLGKIFDYSPELFFEIPVINIDNNIENENFGRINLVDITSSSVSEITMELIDFIDRNLFDQEIATWILTGLIDATDNFQSPKTTPRTFNNAAILINRGGDQQKIIRYLYKTKSLDFLRLWGRVLHKLFWDKEKKIVSGRIKQYDFEETNTGPECLPQIFEEIKTTFPETKISILLWQTSSSDKIKGTIYSLDQLMLNNISYKLNGTLKNNSLLFEVNPKKFITFEDSLKEAEILVLNLINEEL